MNDSIKNGYINWIDGMKISKDHFIDMQRATEDRLRDVRSVLGSEFDMGLLAGKLKGRGSLEYILTIGHPNRIDMEVYQCRALSPAGDRVEIVSDLNSLTNALKATFTIDLEKAEDRDTYDVIIKVDSFNMTPYGEPDVKESPPRHPFAQPGYTLELAPSKEIQYNEYNRNYVVLTRVQLIGSEIKHLKEYIPPCMSMESAAELTEFYFRYLQFVKDLEQNAFRIIIKTNSAEHKTPLVNNVELIARRVFDLIEKEIDDVVLFYRFENPVHFVAHTMRLARCIRNSIELTTNAGKDELLNYFSTEVMDLSSAEYMNVLSGLFGMEYQHYDINACLTRISSFCKHTAKLFDELSRLDYIGKKKDIGIFVTDKTKEDTLSVAQKRRKWDF
ncbi:MAG: hypothetical protein KA408_05465 [Flavobacteriales bacterium]|nr:hypothetical protein [Flavobacteriales bacterium]